MLILGVCWYQRKANMKKFAEILRNFGGTWASLSWSLVPWALLILAFLGP